MQPFHFGDSLAKLYGVYDPPATTAHQELAVVLCYPMGQEYMRAHLACRQLMRSLNRVGIHGMRFDYFGTGDSAGTLSEASIQIWQANIAAALAEMEDVSGVTSLALCGLRLGGSLAAVTQLPDRVADRLVLWDPVVTGSSYLAELRAMQQQLLDNLRNLYGTAEVVPDPETEEIIGFRYDNKLIAEIDNLNLLQHNQFSSTDIRLVVSEPQPEYEQLREHLDSLGILGGYHLTSPPGQWDTLSETENALIAAETITTICNQLSK